MFEKSEGNLMKIGFIVFWDFIVYSDLMIGSSIYLVTKKNIDKFKAKGIDSVICVAVNDPYVMNAWADKLQAKDVVSHFKLIMLYYYLCTVSSSL